MVVRSVAGRGRASTPGIVALWSRGSRSEGSRSRRESCGSSGRRGACRCSSRRRCSARTPTATSRRGRSCTSGSIRIRHAPAVLAQRRPGARAGRGRSVLAPHDRAVRPAVPVDRERDRGARRLEPRPRRAPDPRARRWPGSCCSRCSPRGWPELSARTRRARRGGSAQPARPARAGGRGAQRSLDDWFGGRRRHIRHRATAAAGHRGVCALAATIKLPAAAAIPFILVACADRRTWWRGVLVAAAVVVAVSVITGLGLGWISTTVFSTPDKVRLAITPATALGWTVAQVVPVGARGLESALGVVAFGLSLVLGAVLLWRSRRESMVRNLGIALIAVAVCGPAAWPWYLTWGLVLLAACPRDPGLAGARGGGRGDACSWSRPTASWPSRCTPRRCSSSFTWRPRSPSWSSCARRRPAVRTARLRPLAES